MHTHTQGRVIFITEYQKLGFNLLSCRVVLDEKTEWENILSLSVDYLIVGKFINPLYSCDKRISFIHTHSVLMNECALRYSGLNFSN